MKARSVTCKNCGWIHMARPRNDIAIDIKSFLDYIKSEPLEVQERFGVSDSLEQEEQKMWNRQMHCFNCGGHYTNFRDTVEGDGPGYPVTIQSILDRSEW